MVFFPLKDINPRISFPFVTITLIVANVVAFLFSLQNFEPLVFNFGFIPATASILTAFTAMFLHGGFDHIFGNMWYLWLFSDNVEDVFGRIHYLLFYLLSGLFATLAHYLTNLNSIIPAIGASGAISGVLGAYLIFFPHIKVKAYTRYVGVTEISATSLLVLWFLMQLLFSSISLLGGAGSGIAFSAHAGGFVFGYIYARVFKRLFPRRIPSEKGDTGGFYPSIRSEPEEGSAPGGWKVRWEGE